MFELTEYDRVRYHRQMLIDRWGEEGQLRLKQAKVFIIGAGGLGSPVSIYLAYAGVGEIKICDKDTIELSNLNRQILHFDSRIGERKADSAGKTLREINPTINIITFPEYLNKDNIDEIIGSVDIIVDCLDNFETRYLLNEYSIKKRIPLVYGAIWGLDGQLTFLNPPETPCLRCIFSEAPPKEVFPVLGATPGVIGTLQAMEVLKFLTEIGKNLKGKLLIFNGEEMRFEKVNIRRIPNCPDCGDIPRIN